MGIFQGDSILKSPILLYRPGPSEIMDSIQSILLLKAILRQLGLIERVGIDGGIVDPENPAWL